MASDPDVEGNSGSHLSIEEELDISMTMIRQYDHKNNNSGPDEPDLSIDDSVPKDDPDLCIDDYVSKKSDNDDDLDISDNPSSTKSVASGGYEPSDQDVASRM
jgi:hypothetical protein